MNEDRNYLRDKIIYFVLCLSFLILVSKVAYISVVKGHVYSGIADESIYRQISVDAPRGEIRDRYGVLLAGNKEIFSVEIYPENQKAERLNENILNLVNLLEENDEEIIEEFPIIIDKDKFEFVYEKNLLEWKKSNNIPESFTAEQTFDYIVESLVSSGAINLSPEDDNSAVQSKIIEAGYYPPISVSKNEFSDIVKKNEFLQRYLGNYYKKDEVLNISAKEAFEKFREHYKIDKTLSDEDAKKIINIRFLISEKGYYQYEPTLVSENIKSSTVSKIEENSLKLSGVNIKVSSVRYYPKNNHASHIIGQVGKISSQSEIDKYVKEQKYSINDIIGKTGIERALEDKLKGEKGFTQVQVDSKGRLIKSLSRQDSKSGNTVYLTIDSKLQEVAEESLKRTLQTIQSGGTYTSKWGNIRMRDIGKIYNKATSGAVVVLDVNNGDVLAMASYPDYDPNLFVRGINAEDFKKLTPKNLNDSLAPKPLYNVATLTTVQPGSTFKMLTGLTAIELGLSPYYEIYDKGYIKMGNHTFGCWLWNMNGGSHGNENLMDALRDSCNYYFYSVSTGYNYATNEYLPIKIKAQNILDYATRFGLNEKSGIEIEEISGKVPSVEEKLNTKKRELKSYLMRKMKYYFVSTLSDEDYEKKIDEIVSWMDENPTRGQIIDKLGKLGVKENLIEEITDITKYSYFNQGKWQTGDSFNMSIGQGDHKYSPIQMARYVSAIANDGYLNKIKVVKESESSDKANKEIFEDYSEKIELNNRENLKYIRQGMEDVTDEGTSRQDFANFPVKVASKTGTAQKSGSIPAENEEEYLLSHLPSYGVSKDKVIELTNKLEKEDKFRRKRNVYMIQAILELNPNMTIDRINMYKDKYDPFAWFVSYAPAEKPEIAVVTLLFQGGHGSFGAAVARDVYAEYFNLSEDNTNINKFTFEEKLG